LEINKIKITGETIANAIDYNYPTGIINMAAIKKNKLYNYLVLWGVRVATCDTSMPDDAIGGIRLKKDFFGNDYWEIVFSEGTTDPTPYWLQNPMSDAKVYGGTAWVAEGQYLYSKGYGSFQGYPFFAPINPVKVYRWTPSASQIALAKKNKLALSNAFESAKSSNQVKISDTTTVLIHRSWSPKNLYKDSAGCQVFADNGALTKMTKWASEHIKIYGKNSFAYTLLTKEQFTMPNQGYTGSIFDLLKF